LGLIHTNVSDLGLESLAELRQLDRLELNGTQVAGPGLSRLPSSITWLWLHESQIDDEALVHLRGLTDLGALTLHNTSVSGAGLVRLKGLAKLRGLSVNTLETIDKVDAQLERAGGFVQVQSLTLSGPHANNNDLKQLKYFPNLTSLSLGRSEIDDVGLKYLALTPRIQVLSLCGSGITDRAVPFLKRITTLRTVMLVETKVSFEGIKELEAALPQTRITPSSQNLIRLREFDQLREAGNALSPKEMLRLLGQLGKE